MAVSVPPVPIRLEDVSSIEQPISENIRFLSALEQEVKSAFAVENDRQIDAPFAVKKFDKTDRQIGASFAVKNEPTDVDEDRAGLFHLKSICTMSAEEVNKLIQINFKLIFLVKSLSLSLNFLLQLVHLVLVRTNSFMD